MRRSYSYHIVDYTIISICIPDTPKLILARKRMKEEFRIQAMGSENGAWRTNKTLRQPKFQKVHQVVQSKCDPRKFEFFSQRHPVEKIQKNLFLHTRHKIETSTYETIYQQDLPFLTRLTSTVATPTSMQQNLHSSNQRRNRRTCRD